MEPCYQRYGILTMLIWSSFMVFWLYPEEALYNCGRNVEVPSSWSGSHREGLEFSVTETSSNESVYSRIWISLHFRDLSSFKTNAYGLGVPNCSRPTGRNNSLQWIQYSQSDSHYWGKNIALHVPILHVKYIELRENTGWLECF